MAAMDTDFYDLLGEETHATSHTAHFVMPFGIKNAGQAYINDQSSLKGTHHQHLATASAPFVGEQGVGADGCTEQGGCDGDGRPGGAQSGLRGAVGAASGAGASSFAVQVPYTHSGQASTERLMLDVVCPSGVKIRVQVPKNVPAGATFECVDPGVVVVPQPCSSVVPIRTLTPDERHGLAGPHAIDDGMSFDARDNPGIELEAESSEWAMWQRLNRAGSRVADPDQMNHQEMEARALAEQRHFSSVDLFAIDSIDAGSSESMESMARMQASAHPS